MNKKRKIINLVGLVFAACLFVWSVTTHEDILFHSQDINAEINLFEMSIEELMEIEVASAPQETETISKVFLAEYFLRNQV
jgi:hypothetical protein